jgi:hypothetical protein
MKVLLSLLKRTKIISFVAFTIILTLFSEFSQPIVCSAQVVCNPDWRRSGTQPFPTEISTYFDDAGLNRLGSSSLPLQNINQGFPQFTSVSPYVPCVLLKAIGAVESAQTRGAANFNGWKQFNANYGASGTTVVNSKVQACGYGIMQVTDGMNTGGNAFPIGILNQVRVSTELKYNIGAATIILINKWNQIDQAVGNNNPAIVEHWYFATWAYNSFSPVNDPNNQRFPESRSSWRCGRLATQNDADYPYQEKVWGCMRNPPVFFGSLLWAAVPVGLPNSASITSPPQSIPWTSPRNYSCTRAFIPIAR